MAFTPTVLQEAILNTQQSAGYGIAENEKRQSRYGAAEAYKMGTERVIPASTLRSIKEATAQPTSIDVFQREAIGSGTSRACEGTGTGTTVNVPITWVPFQEQFALSWVEHEGNRTAYQEAFNHMFNERLRSLYTRIDSEAVLQLEANKAAAAGNQSSIYGFDLVDTDAKTVPLADELNFFNNASVEMAENDFYGPYINIASTSQRALQRYDMAQGSQNGVNLEFQMEDFRHMTSNRISVPANNKSVSYLVDPSAIGMVSWTNALSRAGKDIGTDVWDTFVDPLMGMNVELKVKKGCADNSGSFAGAEADYVESFVMFVEVAYIHSYDSVLGAPIFKYLLADS